MKIKILSYFVMVSLFFGSSFADTITAKSNQAVDVDTNYNPLRDYAKKTSVNTDSAITTPDVSSNEASMNMTTQTEDNAPQANDYGDALSSLVDTSDDDYDKLIAEANAILADSAPSETKKKIDAFNKELEEKSKKEKDEFIKSTASNTLSKASDIVNSNQIQKVDEKFDKSYNTYSEKSSGDYINENVKNYDKDYKPKNYDGLIESISTPKDIEESFNDIDEDEKDNFRYKLKDGYPIEQITTVGLLDGEQKRYKKCLIMKTYGGGTWRTYCQPLKKPTKCPDYDWQQLSSMSILYC
ncbi:hypothetical protein IB633_09665 [Francisella philomiragia]|uniref:Uncharacterized protein n=1 Tax=Francisella philomiragia subsp. philomiragia (strain ATCC 25017 / CCUG 19701 / FSC 153 / O\|nr:hypothetical protein [Francisella philomiragia]AJI48095.1 hypothetical protein BF30_580 [Francisella philomiragia]AJI49268.1 hypothetical protein KU46_974 [Francisella philomiragia]MBK2021403.1 hypothetical protein [Francisella philomiragia]MBK2031309.1 hypothetical protein [Francisella philomiragia]MBK2264263.1 hypothetical protein [Francisella philomiragia]